MSKGGGNAPQPVDPYQQAAAQYGLSTGTAAFNAGLGRPNTVNPVGSTTWSTAAPPPIRGAGQAGYGGGGGYPQARMMAPGGAGPGMIPSGGGYSGGGYSPYPFGLGGGSPTTSGFGGAPRYTQTTTLAPQFESTVQTPLDTSQIPGMPGGPSLEQNVLGSQEAAYNQQMDLLAPLESHQIDATKANLAAEGATPGSAAYNWGMEGLGLELAPQNAEVANQAYLTGINTLPTLYGLGTTSLQNQIQAQNQPINEWLAFNGGGGAPTAPAMTPDISGAFGQQYQGQLAAYNANQASANQTTSDLSGLAAAALFAMSDRRKKRDIKRVGELDSGEGIYTFRYKPDSGADDGRTHMGVMAQEIEDSKPGAVFSLGGTKFVNYGAI